MHMVFINLDKAYDKLPRNVIWWPLQKHKVSTKYVILIKDMHDNRTNVPCAIRKMKLLTTF
jgi:hypothetical protein